MPYRPCHKYDVYRMYRTVRQRRCRYDNLLLFLRYLAIIDHECICFEVLHIHNMYTAAHVWQ